MCAYHFHPIMCPMCVAFFSKLYFKRVKPKIMDSNDARRSTSTQFHMHAHSSLHTIKGIATLDWLEIRIG